MMVSMELLYVLLAVCISCVIADPQNVALHKNITALFSCGVFGDEVSVPSNGSNKCKIVGFYLYWFSINYKGAFFRYEVIIIIMWQSTQTQSQTRTEHMSNIVFLWNIIQLWTRHTFYSCCFYPGILQPYRISLVLSWSRTKDLHIRDVFCWIHGWRSEWYILAELISKQAICFRTTGRWQPWYCHTTRPIAGEIQCLQR